MDIRALASEALLDYNGESSLESFATLIEAEIRKEYEAEKQTLKNTLAHRAKEIELLKADLLDEWTDDKGNTWVRPTS